MIPATARPFNGIYVATLTPFRGDGGLDEDALAQHFGTATAEPGIVGVLCNGHAGENYLLDAGERCRVTAVAADTVGRSHIVVCGILAESTREAAQQARDAAASGADVVLVFPPFSWALSQDDRMAITHHKAVIEAAGLPVMLYQAGTASALAYTPEVLAALVQLPGVVGIKEGSWESNAYDRNRRLVERVAPHVAIMASGDEHLLSCFIVGSEGSLVSLAALIPAEIVALDRAVAARDLDGARALHARIQPLANAIYGHPPGILATARLKACMALLGRWHWHQAAPRAPITALPEAEIDRLRAALITAGCLGGHG